MSRKKRKTGGPKTREKIAPPPRKERPLPEEPGPQRGSGRKIETSARGNFWNAFRSIFQPVSAHLRSDLPLHGCWVNQGWEEQGMAMVCIARRMENGNVVFGFYLVDVWGLGLKDCFGNVGIPPGVFHSQVLPKLGRGAVRLVQAEPSLARTLIWGGYAWAMKHQFRLPREFRRWQKLVGELEEGESEDDIAFGREGHPFIIM